MPQADRHVETCGADHIVIIEDEFFPLSDMWLEVLWRKKSCRNMTDAL